MSTHESTTNPADADWLFSSTQFGDFRQHIGTVSPRGDVVNLGYTQDLNRFERYCITRIIEARVPFSATC